MKREGQASSRKFFFFHFVYSGGRKKRAIVAEDLVYTKSRDSLSFHH